MMFSGVFQWHSHHDHQVTNVVAPCCSLLLSVALLHHTALQTPTSTVRTQSRVLSHVDDQSCCSRTLLAAPSLSLRPSSGIVTFTMKSSDTTASQTATLSNSVPNSNPAVIQTIQSKGWWSSWLRCTPPSRTRLTPDFYCCMFPPPSRRTSGAMDLIVRAGHH